ncbi:arylesterase [Parasphingopyxis sp. CP4]|uniref:arylesterase n=1 Tax=Parasphingopyxis sp. CP4 TaxID=2724527 RepID=UPI0015A22F16|nr:arylesterase [Parasphingopyxis sp. CP4]QLC23047.1 arylesterase [Parasphingopyxis sp. CP4]
MNVKLCIYGALLLAVQPLAGCANDGGSSEPAVDRNVGSEAETATAGREEYDELVVAFGDSLYAGYGLSQDEGFAPELQRALTERGRSVRVLNAGVSGDTTAAGRQRLAFTLDGLDRAPDLVIVGLGGNDMLRGLSPEQTRENLTAILDELEARDVDAMLTGMVAAPNLGADYAEAFNPIYGELAAQYDAPLYPFFLDGVIQDPSLMLADGIHPTAEGIDRVVAQLTDLVETELAEE